MREVVVKVYKFNELSEKAKQYAVEKYAWDDIYNDFITENMEQILSEYGFTDAKVSWSLSSCQGDGVSFTGEWYGNELKNILDKAGVEIPPEVLSDCTLKLTRRNSHYVHEMTVQVDLENNYCTDEDYDKYIKPTEEVLETYRLKICYELTKIGYKDIEYYSSEESFANECEGNELEFYEDGTIC